MSENVTDCFTRHIRVRVSLPAETRAGGIICIKKAKKHAEWFLNEKLFVPLHPEVCQQKGMQQRK